MYAVKKFLEYFRPKVNRAFQNEALKILNEKEKKIFLEMSKYDKFHCLEVYKKVKRTKLKNKEVYLKLALLHDCGKENANFLIRVLHKLGFKTSLKEHSQNSFFKLEKINGELANLAKNHHAKNFSEDMDIFQECDDAS